jgi:hypothetical protein
MFNLCSPETKYKHKCFVNNIHFSKYFKKILDLKEHCPKSAAFRFGFSQTACKYPLYDGTIIVASFLADFYTLSSSASLDYMEYAAMCIMLLKAYPSSDADVDNA